MTDEQFIERLCELLPTSEGVIPTTPIFRNADGINRERTLQLLCYARISEADRKLLLERGEL